MSLDVYLTRKYHVSYDNKKTWEEKTQIVFSANITHNLTEMADKAGIYYACWRPQEIGAKKAKDILPILEKGYKDMKARPEYYKQFDSPNGWGMYKHFLPWIKEYIDACKQYPDAEITADR